MKYQTPDLELFNPSDAELKILQNIYALSDHVRQRDLARIAGLSLGMTNAIVKRLAQKGWLTIRKINNRNIRYAISTGGLEQITRRSYRFFKRTIKNIVYYREAIEAFVRDVKSRGYRDLVLIGKSDLDFIIEHACAKCGVEYLLKEQQADMTRREEEALFLLYSEGYIPDIGEKGYVANAAFLQDVVSGSTEPSLDAREGRDG